MREKPEYIVIHQTGVSRSRFAEQLSVVENSHRAKGYDLNANGYHICYHYFIGTTGKIVHSRPDTDRTMCTKNNDVNMKAIQVVLAGDFSSEIPTPAQVKAMMALVSSLQEKYGVLSTNVIGHREASPTACPGKHVMRILEHYRKRL